LLAAYDARRPTRDADFAARNLADQVVEVTRVVREIAGITLHDGLVFDPGSARGQIIRDEDMYSGVRVHLDCRLATARTHLNVDVNVGDPVWPAPEPIHVPRLLDEGLGIDLVGYPLPMVHAEKLVTALQRGTVNTRWRDFADIYLLAHQQPILAQDLAMSLTAVAQHRSVALTSLSEALVGYSEVPGVQTKWVAWRRRQRLEDRLPERFTDVLTQVSAFADPVIAGTPQRAVWRPEQLTWVPVDGDG
jgi:hypothetical protein